MAETKTVVVETVFFTAEAKATYANGVAYVEQWKEERTGLPELIFGRSALLGRYWICSA